MKTFISILLVSFFGIVSGYVGAELNANRPSSIETREITTDKLTVGLGKVEPSIIMENHVMGLVGEDYYCIIMLDSNDMKVKLVIKQKGENEERVIQ